MKTATLSRASSTRPRFAKAGAKGLAIRSILVPVDFSEPSLRAIDQALLISKHFGAALNLVHVFEPEYPVVGMAGMPLFIPDSEVGPRVRRHLHDVALRRRVSAGQSTIHAIKGRPFQEICRLARKIDIDLIVIPTRGNTGLKHVVLGSTAERVVRYSPCPVLVVRGDDSETKKSRVNFSRRALHFRKILVPIDFSECSMKGLRYAKALAREFGSTLVLLNSVHFPYYVASDEYARYDLPRLMQYAEKIAKEQMRNVVQRTQREGLKVETSFEAGHAGQQICDRARDRAVDLIVTSTHGTTGFKHVLLGSTAEYVVRHAPCPVLVVPKRPSESPINASKQK
jgi:nucleotide-binding universal stress UspA family protein